MTSVIFIYYIENEPDTYRGKFTSTTEIVNYYLIEKMIYSKLLFVLNYYRRMLKLSPLSTNLHIKQTILTNYNTNHEQDQKMYDCFILQKEQDYYYLFGERIFI